MNKIIYNFIKENGMVITSQNNTEYRCLCPLHHDKNTSFSINKNNGKFICFAGCGSGDFIKLVSLIKKLSRNDSLAFIYGKDPLVRLKAKISSLAKTYDESVEDTLSLDKVNVPNECIELDKIELCPDYLLKRINFETIKKFKLKKIVQGNLKHRIVTPIYENQEQVGYIARDYLGTSSIKNLYPPKWKVSKYIFNIDNVDIKRRVIITEGVFDAMKLTELGFTNVVAILGINFNMDRIKKLTDKGVKKIAICFDNDAETQAGQKASKSTVEYVKYLFDTLLVKLPDGKDPDECTTEQLNEAFLNAKKM